MRGSPKCWSSTWSSVGTVWWYVYLVEYWGDDVTDDWVVSPQHSQSPVPRLTNYQETWLREQITLSMAQHSTAQHRLNLSPWFLVIGLMIVDHPGCFLPDLTSQQERLPGGIMSSSSFSLLKYHTIGHHTTSPPPPLTTKATTATQHNTKRK